MNRHNKIDYVEFSTSDMNAPKTFFTKVFGRSFTDYGPDYADRPDGGIMTGFLKWDGPSTQKTGGALITFFSKNLKTTQAKLETGGNEFAVWSDVGLE